MQRVRAGNSCAEQRLLRRRAFRYPVRRLATPRRCSHGHRARDQKHARCPGTNLSCDPRPEMGRCAGRLRTGWRMFRRQLRGGRRGLASRPCRPSYSRLPAATRYDFAGTSRPARSNGQNRRFDLRLWRPLRLFQAGLIAGCFQAGLVCVMTPMVMVFAQYPDHDPGASGRSPAAMLIAFLPLIYVTLAAGVALTKHRYVTLTTARIRHASHLMSSSDPDRLAGTLAICHFLASIGCASYTLQPPPVVLVAMDLHLGPHPAAPILWSALISVCVAGFGANAHAATDAAY